MFFIAAVSFVAASSLVGNVATARAETSYPSDLLSPFAESAFLDSEEGMNVRECAEKNPQFYPDFTDQGFKCCNNRQFWSATGAGTASKRHRRGGQFCAPGRNGWDKCGERTPEQVRYEAETKKKIAAHSIGQNDIVELLESRMRNRIDLKEHSQSYCSFGNGFVVDALPILPTSTNRLLLNWQDRCANYAGDPLFWLIEKTGNEIRKEFSEEEFANARLILGDAGAPKGGCLAVRRGRRGHGSHTNGQDIDIAYFNPVPMNERQIKTLRAYRDETKSDDVPDELLPSQRFVTDMYVASNWWLLKKLLNTQNEFSCVRSVFVDQRHKDQLARYAASIQDPDWARISDYIMHIKGHFNHFHLRVLPKPRNGICLSLNSIKRLAADEFKRTGKMPDVSTLGLGDLEEEYYDDPDSAPGDPSKAGADDSDDPTDPDDTSIDDSEAGSAPLPAGIKPGQKPSEVFAKSQVELAKGATQDKAAAVAAVAQVQAQAARASSGEKVVPDYKREPSVSRNFPVRGGKGKRGKRGKHRKGKRNPSSVQTRSSKKSRR